MKNTDFIKKLVLLFAAASAIASASAQANDYPAESYDPLVREGKIWWYAQSQTNEPLTLDFVDITVEYGFTFDGEDIITEQTYIDAGMRSGEIRDEGPWQKLVVIRKVKTNFKYNTVEFLDVPLPAHYLKEENKIVRAIDAVPNTREFYRHDMHAVGISPLFPWDRDVLGKMLPILYNFEDNEDDLLIGDDGQFVRLSFKCKERKDFFGTERLVKTFVKRKWDPEEMPQGDPLFQLGEGSEIDITEGIGLTAVRHSIKRKRDPNEVFFSPFTFTTDKMKPVVGDPGWGIGPRQPMLLRYVTDMDYNIIYEGIGGVKAWELEPSGVEDVAIDSHEAVEWYTIGGVKVSEPSAPGAYIRRSGSTAEKVIVR